MNQKEKNMLCSPRLSFPDPLMYSGAEVPCWDEEVWGEMTEEDWEEYYRESYDEVLGG